MSASPSATPAANAHPDEGDAKNTVAGKDVTPDQPVLPREIGGRDGPEPTRFGDWEKGGRCIDF